MLSIMNIDDAIDESYATDNFHQLHEYLYHINIKFYYHSYQCIRLKINERYFMKLYHVFNKKIGFIQTRNSGKF